MALFSRISTFCSPSFSVLTTIALANDVMGIDSAVGNKEERGPRNFLAIHSAGLLSCLSTNNTLNRHKKVMTGYLMILKTTITHAKHTKCISSVSELHGKFIAVISGKKKLSNSRWSIDGETLKT